MVIYGQPLLARWLPFFCHTFVFAEYSTITDHGAMTCLTANRVAELIAERDTKQAQLTAMDTAYTAAIADGIESYKFDSGEGSQQVKRRSLTEMMDAMKYLRASINSLNRILRGTNNHYQGMVRTPGHHHPRNCGDF